jgi:hypothetical protein
MLLFKREIGLKSFTDSGLLVFGTKVIKDSFRLSKLTS